MKKSRIEWSDDQRRALTEMYGSGEALATISQWLRMSETSVKAGIVRFDLASGKSLLRRKEGIVRRLWGTRPAGNIAQAYRLGVEEVRTIAERLALGPEAHSMPTQVRRKADHDRLRWALRFRHCNREASLIWDMARVSMGFAPIGKGYAA